MPPRGTQFAAVVECERVRDLTAAADWGGFSLQHVNVLQDTASLVFTKQYGFRFSSVPSRRLAPPIAVLECDFARDAPGFVQDEREIHFAAGFEKQKRCVFFPSLSLDDDASARRREPDSTHPSARGVSHSSPSLTVPSVSCPVWFFAGPEGGVAHCVMLYWEATLGVRLENGLETGLEASDDGACSGKPHTMCESIEPSIVRIGDWKRTVVTKR